MFDPELAQAVVEQHFRSPRNRGRCEHETASGETTNPMCGDEVTVSINVVDDQIECARFEGQGCALSQAGASLVTDWLQGKSVDEARDGLSAFVDAMRGGDLADTGDLEALYAVRENPARVTCAALAADEVLRLLDA